MLSLEEAKKLSKEGKISALPKLRKPSLKKDPVATEIKKVGSAIAKTIETLASSRNPDMSALINHLKDAGKKQPINITIDRPKEWELEFKISRDEMQRMSSVRVVAIAKE